MEEPAVRLFVGGGAGTYKGEPDDLTGDRCYTAAWPATKNINRLLDLPACRVLLDSGAFTDKPGARLLPPDALRRQLAWERAAGARTGHPDWRAQALVSYDLLIDETWTGDVRTKRRWSVADAERAVDDTVQAARYLAAERRALAPRTLVLSCQGVDADQYARCAARVLEHADPADWLGLGGWCILGRFKSWLPVFWQTIWRVLPLAAQAGLRHAHIFGVLWPVALGGLVWVADQHGITLSADSNAPVLNALCAPEHQRKSGARRPHWRDNVRWWRDHLAQLRATRWYAAPPLPSGAEQLTLF